MEGEGLSHHSAQNKLNLLLLLLLRGKQFHLEPLKRPPLHSSPRDLDLNALWKTKTDLASVCLCLWGNLFLFILSELFLPSRPPPRSNASFSDWCHQCFRWCHRCVPWFPNAVFPPNTKPCFPQSLFHCLSLCWSEVKGHRGSSWNLLKEISSCNC